MLQGLRQIWPAMPFIVALVFGKKLFRRQRHVVVEAEQQVAMRHRQMRIAFDHFAQRLAGFIHAAFAHQDDGQRALEIRQGRK
jgi:hypothetical protein